MKFLHTADLHIGKKIFEHSLLEDQKYILNQILEIAKKEKVDALLVAGDVYDRAIPSTEAVSLLDDFLTRLNRAKIPVVLISGNHDSPERVAFAEQILEQRGLYIAGTYSEKLKTIDFQDQYGTVSVVCMPFVKPAVVGAPSSAQAVEMMLKQFFDTARKEARHVLLTHYFVTGEQGENPELSDSETDVNVGGLDSVPAGLFGDFEYVALGHIHRPQRIGKGQVYYAGAPLKYSFGEANNEKCLNLVELGTPGEVSVRKIPLKPMREMRCLKGKLADLINQNVLELSEADKESYIQATLTDTEELIDAMGTLRSVYPNALQILLEKNQIQTADDYECGIHAVKKSTMELFSEFYEMLKGEPMDRKRYAMAEAAAKEAENGGEL